MHETPDNDSENVPVFVQKLWILVDEPSTDEFIHWDSTGLSFHIHDRQRMAREILPAYFKHCRMSTFIRQLNSYSFCKMIGKKSEDDWQFQHQFFRRGQKDLLQFVKHKLPTTYPMAAKKAEKFSEVLSDIKQIKSKQNAMNKVLSVITSKQGAMNETLKYIKSGISLLLEEVALLTLKDDKQEQIVNQAKQMSTLPVRFNLAGQSVPLNQQVTPPLANSDVIQEAPCSPVSSEMVIDVDENSNDSIQQTPMFPVSISLAGLSVPLTQQVTPHTNTDLTHLAPHGPVSSEMVIDVDEDSNDPTKQTPTFPVSFDNAGLSIPLNQQVAPLTSTDCMQLAPHSTVSSKRVVDVEGSNTVNDTPKTNNCLSSQTTNVNVSTIRALLDLTRTSPVPLKAVGLKKRKRALVQRAVVRGKPRKLASQVVTRQLIFDDPATSVRYTVMTNSALNSAGLGTEGQTPIVTAGKQFRRIEPKVSNSLSSATTSINMSTIYRVTDFTKGPVPVSLVRMRNSTSVTNPVENPEGIPVKQQSLAPQMATLLRQPVSDAQSNTVMDNSDLNSARIGDVRASTSDTSLDLTAFSDIDELPVSSDQQDHLSSNFNILSGTLEDHYQIVKQEKQQIPFINEILKQESAQDYEGHMVKSEANQEEKFYVT